MRDFFKKPKIQRAEAVVDLFFSLTTLHCTVSVSASCRVLKFVLTWSCLIWAILDFATFSNGQNTKHNLERPFSSRARMRCFDRINVWTKYFSSDSRSPKTRMNLSPYLPVIKATFAVFRQSYVLCMLDIFIYKRNTWQLVHIIYYMM